MTWKVTAEQAAPPVPDGEYHATPVAVCEMNGPHGAMVKIDFQIVSEDVWDGRRVSGIANQKLSANTKLDAWITVILGQAPVVGEEVTEEDILKRPCILVVRRTPNTKDLVFSNVVQVGVRR